MPEPSVLDLQNEIQRLKEEQRDMREQQQKLLHEEKPPQPREIPEQKKQEEPPAQNPRPKRPFRKRFRDFTTRHPLGIVIGAIALVAAIIGGVLLMNYLNSYESTDDAQVDGHLNSVGTRISGTVTAVYVEENQFVNAGQLLVDLDAHDYQTAFEQVRAGYAQARAQLIAANPSVPIVETTNQTTISTGQSEVLNAQAALQSSRQDYEARLANVRQAEAILVKAETDLERYRLLVEKDEISRQQFDAVIANQKTQAAAVEAAKASAEAAQKLIEERNGQLLEARSRLQGASENAPRQVAIQQAEIAQLQAGLSAAQAQQNQARLNLSYTRVLAPVSGIVSQKNVEVGQRVQSAQELLTISQIGDVWVTANFKETQLKNMRPGQSADVRVDAFDTTYQGYVEALPGATGAKTSLLPPENATGNYIKVVQRLPVRIRLKPGQDPEHRLRPGMSVEPKVWLY